MTDYISGVNDERSRIVNLIISLIEDNEVRDWYFGSYGDSFFSSFGYDLVEIIENEK